ncbi:MAG: M23 family metallopeptidase [Balneolaceae bacterium]|nr:M23 family metallopeptidase [Balneolaceae bacterium]
MKVIAAFLILFTVTNSATTISFEVPVEGDAQIVSEFGERTHPVLQTTRSHDGIDYKVSKDSKIVASSSGIIKSVRFLEDEGYSIIIKHDKGLETHYSHLQSVSEDLVVGVEILQRDFLGVPGKSKYADVYMLHFRIYKNGAFIDPALYLIN